MEQLMKDFEIIENNYYNCFKDLVNCPICLNILIDPVICIKCQNCFCKKCINEWLKNNEKCPNYCSGPNFQEKNKTLLSQLKFTCKKCKIVINYDDISKHHISCNKKKNNNIIEFSGKQSIKITSLNDVEKLKSVHSDLIFTTSKKKNINIFIYNIVVILGSEGVGKTTLINR